MTSTRLDELRGWRGCVRLIGVLAVVTWGWYIVALFRTQQFGFSMAVLAAPLLFVLPFAVVPFLGMNWRAAGVGIAGLMILVLTSAETYAALEESRFVREHRKLPANAGAVVQDRQWPFANHHLLFNPQTGECTGGD